MNLRLIVGVMGLLTLSVFPLRAHAQQPSQASIEEMHKACAADVKKLCAGVTAGEGRIGKCLQTNWDKVSATCKKTVAEIAVRTRAEAAAAQNSADSAPATGMDPSGSLQLKDPAQ
ncbi:MAG TPA: cysteine rich repeat-containing protein [Candidatus Binataceae bacterium]|nr:cysteine rich repeat-containing protein [Candidatus Binataceae bacterium]